MKFRRTGKSWPRAVGIRAFAGWQDSLWTGSGGDAKRLPPPKVAHPPKLMKSLCCVIAAFAFASCAQVGQLKTATAGGFTKMSSGLAKATDATMAKIMPPKIPVVEVREKDLKKVQTGQEQAVAFEKTRRNRFWGIFSGPVDFKEPALPSDNGMMEGDLLPPPPVDVE